jgi:biotin operon repressor
MNDELAQAILQHLSVGKKQSIKQKYLASELYLKSDKQIREMRRTITELRHKGYWILSCTKGYYLAETLDEIKEARAYWLKYVKALCVDLRDLKNMEHNFTGQLPLKLDFVIKNT